MEYNKIMIPKTLQKFSMQVLTVRLIVFLLLNVFIVQYANAQCDELVLDVWQDVPIPDFGNGTDGITFSDNIIPIDCSDANESDYSTHFQRTWSQFGVEECIQDIYYRPIEFADLHFDNQTTTVYCNDYFDYLNSDAMKAYVFHDGNQKYYLDTDELKGVTVTGPDFNVSCEGVYNEQMTISNNICNVNNDYTEIEYNFNVAFTLTEVDTDISWPVYLPIEVTGTSYGVVIVQDVDLASSNYCGQFMGLTIMSPSGEYVIPGEEDHVDISNADITYYYTYTLTTDCDTYVQLVPVQITDVETPSGQCTESHEVSLTNAANGETIVYAYAWGIESNDNVGIVNWEIRRLDFNDDFDPFVLFYCEDAGQSIMVEIKITDAHGNSNTVMCTANINDKIDPVLFCPSGLTIDVDEYVANSSDLTIYGSATVDESCDVTVEELSPDISIDGCGSGEIIRTWVAEDASGNTDTCSQVIIVENQTPFTEDDIDWPDDISINDCVTPEVNPDDLPDGYNEPVLNVGLYDQVGVNYSDFWFNSAYNGCAKILRTWTIMDLCQPGSMWQYIQIITITDDIVPEITGCQDTTVIIPNISDGCGSVNITNELDIEYSDNCSTLSDISVEHFIMKYSDISGDFEPFSNGEGMVSGVFENGQYKVDYHVTDHCGNISSCWFMFDVVDKKVPEIYGIAGTNTDLGQMGNDVMATISLDKLDVEFSDNCTDSSLLYAGLRIAGTNDPLTDILFFDCDDADQVIDIEVHAIDESGNENFIVLPIGIQDNFNLCPDIVQYVTISGLINIYNENPLENVHVSLVNETIDEEMTDDEGAFAFEVEEGDDCIIIPYKDDDVLNGVSTYDLMLINKYILENVGLDSPYKKISADINDSGSISGLDVVILRQLILHNIDELPSNDSWRFIPADYDFIDSENPLEEEFPESVSYNSEVNVDLNADFVAVKVGDVSGSAISSYTTNTRNIDLEFLSIENREYNKGEIIEFSPMCSKEIEGGQLEIHFDSKKMSFDLDKTVEKGGLSEKEIGLKYIESGIVLISWIDYFENLPMLIFNVEENGVIPSESIKIDHRYMNSEIYTSGEIFRVELLFSDLKSKNMTLSQNRPNPFSDKTIIEFRTTKEMDVEFIIYTIDGKILIERNISSVVGNNIIELNSANLPKGVLLYSLKTMDEVITKRMIVE